MTRILSTDWFVFLAGSTAFVATTAVRLSTASFQLPERPPDEPARTSMVTESWAFMNPDLDLMIEELKHEKETLTRRERQLKELEARIASERKEIDAATTAFTRIQKELNDSILRIRQEEVPNLKKLARMHASMSPGGSANVLKEQTDEEILKILFYMKPSEAGPIIEAFAGLGKTEARRAAGLTDRLKRSLEAPSKETKS